MENTVAFTGMDFAFNSRGGNVATIFIRLKDWSERKGPGHDASSVAMQGNLALFGSPEGFLYALNPPPIQGLGTAAGYSAQLINKSGIPLSEFNAKSMAFIGAINGGKIPAAAPGAMTGFTYNAPKLYTDLDRERAKALGVNVDSVFSALQTYLGTTYVNDFYYAGRVFKVQMEGETEMRDSPADFGKIFVRNAGGDMLPIDTVASARFTTGPDTVYHFNGYETVNVIGASAPGFSSGQTLDALEKHVGDTLVRDGVDIAWSGASYQEKLSGSASFAVMIFGLVMVFLVLAAQYESWSIPVAVLLSIPIGIFGALVAVLASGMVADVYFLIGLLTLVGLASKNAILIVEFANERVAHGMPLLEAAAEAARLRLRPIVMTSMAFVAGIAPLVIATGAGAGGRRSVGTGVFGGMLAATLIAVFFIPFFFVLVRKLSGKFTRTKDPEVPVKH